MAAILKFETSDKKVIECNHDDIVPFAKNIETLLKEEKITADAPFSLEKVNSDSLNKVLEYIVQLKAELAKKPEEAEKMEEAKPVEDVITCEDWELEFVKDIANPALIDLVNTVEFLGVDTLWNAACIKIGNSCKGRSPEDIRKEWNIENDYTQEEADQLEQDLKWMED